ncbi:TIGR04206 family protein [Haloferax sp. MBLA0076]|uniref:TIGR04206 family protein n=1 Tax=Haloferax litoreum TaxID=2666140 RepID=A0A6A8GC58_9EURY|nr:MULTISPECIES: TIGR04206 family protein [Haloferax]KAB1192039.1 TIGR04206 family protein [Haloferax sp. CBA1148]MRX20481.1 TIGR04206 family protein [Haloferax litoreum]
MTADGQKRGDPSGTVRRRSRLLLVLVVGAVPWSVQTFSSGAATLLFSWGLVTPSTVSLTTITDFLFRFTMGLPDYILLWPLSVVFYLVALVNVLSGVLFGREDIRLTAASLVLAGVTQLELARGFSVQPDRTAWPVGTVLLWAVAGYLYWSHRAETDR